MYFDFNFNLHLTYFELTLKPTRKLFFTLRLILHVSINERINFNLGCPDDAEANATLETA